MSLTVDTSGIGYFPNETQDLIVLALRLWRRGRLQEQVVGRVVGEIIGVPSMAALLEQQHPGVDVDELEQAGFEINRHPTIGVDDELLSIRRGENQRIITNPNISIER